MKRKWKIRLIVISISIITLGVVGYTMLTKLNQGLEELRTTEIGAINLAETTDGVYYGEYKVFPIDVELTVTVLNHHIVDIEITKHITGQGQPAEVIITSVMSNDTLQVDLITGATYSSIVILKAIENALLGD